MSHTPEIPDVRVKGVDETLANADKWLEIMRRAECYEDMLAALEEAINIQEEFYPDDPYVEWMNSAKAAVAKAKGVKP